MRCLVPALSILLLVTVAAANEDLEKLLQDPTKAKVVKEGTKKLSAYFKAAAQVEAGQSKFISTAESAMTDFLEWLAGTKESLGTDLRAHPDIVIDIVDQARIGFLAKTRRGKVEYYKDPDPRGAKRFEYAYLLPQKYVAKNPERYPLIISLHERVINDKHPAFRSKPLQERSRAAVYNGWLKTPASNQAVVIAPTGDPNGFRFTKDTYAERQALMRAVGAGLTRFRTDWNRVFLEVHGEAVRVQCWYGLMFAGLILRDREGSNKPPIPKEEFFMLENLNGTPMLYIADDTTWDDVGLPFSEALKAAYKKAGKEENLLILRDKRDGNGALKGDPEKIAAFIGKHRLPKARKEIHWRFFQTEMTAPLPVEILLYNFDYAPNPPLADKAGRLDFKVSLEKGAGGAGAAEFYNLIDIKITEAEELTLKLYDGLVNLSFPVTVRINGKVIHDKKMVKRNWDLFAKRVLPLHFFMLPVVAELDCKFEHKPQWVEPAEKPKEGAAEEGAAEKGAAVGDEAGKDEDGKSEASDKKDQ